MAVAPGYRLNGNAWKCWAVTAPAAPIRSDGVTRLELTRMDFLHKRKSLTDASVSRDLQGAPRADEHYLTSPLGRHRRLPRTHEPARRGHLCRHRGIPGVRDLPEHQAADPDLGDAEHSARLLAAQPVARGEI